MNKIDVQNEIKIGDKIAYLKYDNDNFTANYTTGWGFVFYIDEESIGLSKPKHSPVYVNYNLLNERCFAVNSKTKDVMTEVVNAEIMILKSKIKSLTADEKDELKRNEFNQIRQQINNTARHMIDDDDTDFINRLKAICDLKSMLFSIKISNLDNSREFNGRIKYQIKKLNDLLLSISKLELTY